MTDQILQEAKGRPSCIAIIICNEVIEDKRTNNKTLVSLFNIIATPQLPTTHSRMFVMASFTGGEGNWPVVFSIRGPSGTEIIRLEGNISFPDRSSVLDAVVEIRGLPITEVGDYFVDVLVDNSLLASRRFVVQVVEGAHEE